MSQFNVYRNPSRLGREDRPFVVTLQSRYLDHFPTRVCAPLVVESAYQPLLKLNPTMRIGGRDHYFSSTELVTLPVRALGKPVANLEDQRDRIIAALDFMMLGI
jgi:toxin CcdB